jgi:RHS repeat-associated protein
MQTAFDYDCTPRPVHLCAFNASLFIGKERDTESGNDYFGARYYASSMGRFISPNDGTGEHFENPQSLNRYAYVFNNPLKLIDPSGHSTQTAANGDVLADYDDKNLEVYRQGTLITARTRMVRRDNPFAFPAYCDYAHPWPLYCYYRLRENRKRESTTGATLPLLN